MMVRCLAGAALLLGIVSCGGKASSTAGTSSSGGGGGDDATGGSGGSGGVIGTGGESGDVIGTGGESGGVIGTGGESEAGATTTGATVSTTGLNTGSGCETSGISGPEPLDPMDGWVSCSSNAAGVEGAFFTFTDGIASTIMPAEFTGTGSEICVRGEVGQVVDGDYAVYGAGVGFNFADERVYDAAAAGVGGVNFNITALPAGTDTRIIFTTVAGAYCATLAEPGAQTWRFNETTLDCWEAGGVTAPATGFISVQWHVTTNAASSHPFDFCITDLEVVPRAAVSP